MSRKYYWFGKNINNKKEESYYYNVDDYDVDSYGYYQTTQDSFCEEFCFDLIKVKTGIFTNTDDGNMVWRHDTVPSWILNKLPKSDFKDVHQGKAFWK